MRRTGLAIVATLAVIAAVPIGAEANQHRPTCSDDETHPHAALSFQTPPPHHAYLNENALELPTLDVERTDENASELTITILNPDRPRAGAFTNGSVNLALQQASQLDLPPVSAQQIFRETNTEQGGSTPLVACLQAPEEGQARAAERIAEPGALNWTLTWLGGMNLSSPDVSYEHSEPAEGLDPDIATVHSTLKATLDRGFELDDRSNHTGAEERGTLEAVIRAEPTAACTRQDKVEDHLNSTNRSLGPDDPGWKRDTGEILVELGLTDLPPCPVKFSFTVRLTEEACGSAAKGCRLAESVNYTERIHKRWTFKGAAESSHMFPNVWASQNGELATLQVAIGEWLEERRNTRQAFEEELASPTGTDTDRLENAHHAYVGASDDVRSAFEAINASERTRMENVDELEQAWKAEHDADTRHFENLTKDHVDTVRSQAEEAWATARTNFLYGFGPALVVAGLAATGFTLRWRKKTEYWSMFSSKADFTHPLRASLILAGVTIAAGIVWVVLDGSFRLTRVMGLPADLLEGFAWI